MSGGMGMFYGAALGGFIVKVLLWGLFLSSLLFFCLGLYYPIMKAEILLGLKEDFSYLTSAVSHFYKEGDYFIGTLILVFCLILPVGKYIFIGLNVAGVDMSRFKLLHHILEFIAKWAMLDVFVVALVIVNMKFDSLLIKTQLAVGTTFFALSILLLAVLAYILNKMRPLPVVGDADFHPNH